MGMTDPFKYIVSIGTHCHTSSALKDAGLKRFSCPFDWIFASPTMVADCLDDDFADLLDSSMYTKHSLETPCKARKRAGHAKYGNQTFNHHDPRMEADYDYFCRCVYRFRKVAKDHASRKIFMYFNVNAQAQQGCIKCVYEALKKYGVKNFVFLVISHVVNPQINEASITFTQPESIPVYCAQLETKSPSNGLLFRDANDNKVLKEFLQTTFVYDLQNI